MNGFDLSFLDQMTFEEFRGWFKVVLQLVVIPLAYLAWRNYRTGRVVRSQVDGITAKNGGDLTRAKEEISALFRVQDETHRDLRNRLDLDINSRLDHLTAAMDRLGTKIDGHLQWHSESGPRRRR